MRFLTDENIPRNVIRLLREMGHDVLDVREQHMAGLPDAGVSELAKNDRRILITLDTDFANILEYPPSDYAGIIVVRIPMPTQNKIADILKGFVAAVNELDIDQTLIILTPERYRIRRDE